MRKCSDYSGRVYHIPVYIHLNPKIKFVLFERTLKITEIFQFL